MTRRTKGSRLNALLACVSLLQIASTPASADTSLEALQSRIVGSWTSISCELRPSPNPQDPSGTPVPTYLTRDFSYGAEGGFDATITVFADSACQVPAIAYDFSGHVVWHDANPAVEGAWSQDYVLDERLVLRVLAEPMAEQLNGLPDRACGNGPFVVGEARDILGEPCALLNFVEGSQFVIDHDFLYVRADTPNMLFMGGKHVDGTGFYYPQNRPTVGLQQPLISVE
ncbi:MAG: hypothetical protein KI785_10730 [Devosiaceae bacterium]|nr:hypothetical protein [Devosiaceae bacterium MH13]